jgi:hypothetical protein
MTVGFVVKPISVVDVAIGMKEFTSSTSLVVLPHALVPCLVWPHHSALAMSQTTFPLALVDSACLVVVSATFNGNVFLVNSTQRFLRFFMFEIFAVYFRSHFQDLVFASLQEATD